jgi:hypothetical protein
MCVWMCFCYFAKNYGIIKLNNTQRFYLPHMEYEGSIGLVMGKMKKNIADFQVFGLCMAKKHDLSEKNIPSVTRHRKTKFVSSLQPLP